MLLFDPARRDPRPRDRAALAANIGTSLRRADGSSISANGYSVALQTSEGVHHSGRCIVCAGAGTDRLVRPLGIEVHQLRQAHVRLAFRVKTTPRRPLPCFSDRTGAQGEVVSRQAISATDTRSSWSVFPPTWSRPCERSADGQRVGPSRANHRLRGRCWSG
jgi:hypothetical protein